MEKLTINQAERALVARYRLPTGCLRTPAALPTGQRFWAVDNGEFYLTVCDYRSNAAARVLACEVQGSGGATLWRFNCC